ncbi:hypothetical protein MMC06_003070 [Schaereria dolodes]|nr:hypothetical protein [Schaereria dolodes]
MSFAPPKLTPYELEHFNDSQIPKLYGVDAVLMAVALAAVIGRFHARRVRKLPFKQDDWLIIPAMVSSMTGGRSKLADQNRSLQPGAYAFAISQTIGAYYGFGKHVWALTFPQIIVVIKTQWASNIVYVTAQFCTKMSILLLYRRIFTTLDRTFAIALWVTMAYIAAWSIAVLMLGIFGCVPVNKVWDETIPGKCVGGLAAQAAPNFLSVFADFVILCLPGIVLFKLHMTVGRKLGLWALFIIGLFSCAAGLARAGLAFRSYLDATWAYPDLFIWSAVEMTVGIVCACVPVIVPAFSGDLFKKRSGSSGIGRFMAKLFGSKHSPSSYQKARTAARPTMHLNRWPSSKMGSKADSISGSKTSDTPLPVYTAAQLPRDRPVAPNDDKDNRHIIHPMNSDRGLLTKFSKGSPIRDEEQAVPGHATTATTEPEGQEQHPWESLPAPSIPSNHAIHTTNTGRTNFYA